MRTATPYFPSFIPFLADIEFTPVPEGPRQHHVSIQNLRYEPEELMVGPCVEEREDEPQNRLAQELLVRLFQICDADPRNILILYHGFCRKKTFVELSHDPKLYGLTPDTIRKRFDKMARRLRG